MRLIKGKISEYFPLVDVANSDTPNPDVDVPIEDSLVSMRKSYMSEDMNQIKILSQGFGVSAKDIG